MKCGRKKIKILKGLNKLNKTIKEVTKLKFFEIVEVHEQTAKNLRGLKREEVKPALLSTPYPELKIRPKNTNDNIKRINKKKDHNVFGKFAKKNKPKSFSFLNLVVWIVSLPSKLVGWILKSMLREKDHINGKWLL